MVGTVFYCDRTPWLPTWPLEQILQVGRQQQNKATQNLAYDNWTAAMVRKSLLLRLGPLVTCSDLRATSEVQAQCNLNSALFFGRLLWQDTASEPIAYLTHYISYSGRCLMVSWSWLHHSHVRLKGELVVWSYALNRLMVYPSLWGISRHNNKRVGSRRPQKPVLC